MCPLAFLLITAEFVMEEKTIKVYVAQHFLPCKEVEQLIREGKLEGIELVDIETDQGFEEFTREILAHGDSAVPSAYKDGQKCSIRIDDEDRGLIIDCPSSEQG